MPGQPQLVSPVTAASATGIDCTELNVLDSLGVPSNLIINAGDSFNVAAKFLIGGATADFIHDHPADFKVTYYYEGMGIAPDGELGYKDGNTGNGVLITAPPVLIYEYSGAVTTPATPVTLPAPGVYKLSAVVTFVGLNFTAFCDGPMIQQR